MLNDDPLLSIFISLIISIRRPHFHRKKGENNLRLSLTWVYYLHLTSQITIRPIDSFKHWSKTSSVDDVSVKTHKTKSLFTCLIYLM